MVVKQSKLKSGILKIGTATFQTQATNVRITPPDQPTGNDGTEVLAGDVLTDENSKDGAWLLKVDAIQDFDDVNGFVMFCFTNQGSDMPFEWTPNAKITSPVAVPGTGHKWAGTLSVWPVELGGDVNKRLTTSAEFRLAAKPVRSEAT